MCRIAFASLHLLIITFIQLGYYYYFWHLFVVAVTMICLLVIHEQLKQCNVSHLQHLGTLSIVLHIGTNHTICCYEPGGSLPYYFFG